MIRPVLAVAAVAFGVTAVIAASDPITTRQELMKANGREAKAGAAMAKGEAPFDLGKAKAIFTTFADSAAKMPALFPENSKTGHDTTVSPKVWENMSDVKARFQKFEEDARKAAAATKDLETFKVNFQSVGKSCGGCHEIYRIKKS
ncbi:MAG TPA: cytochrome c [Xanthobacteraceae bacterium]|jgi:cytochrome c556|nr:cytochrome c [Xanthobacteraceae bacterium]